MNDKNAKNLDKLEGIVEEALPGLSFRVKVIPDRLVLAHLSGKMRLHHIRIVPGDRVTMEMSPDGGRGRIVRRN